MSIVVDEAVWVKLVKQLLCELGITRCDPIAFIASTKQHVDQRRVLRIIKAGR